VKGQRYKAAIWDKTGRYQIGHQYGDDPPEYYDKKDWIYWPLK
jgi:hypothetical protein